MTRWSAQSISLIVTLALGGGQAWAQSSPASSNASNNQQDAQLSINGRTGGVTISIDLFTVPGVVAGMEAKLKLSYRSEEAKNEAAAQISYFGMPYGWSLGLSFISDTGVAQELNLNGTQSYTLDDQWETIFTPTGASSGLAAFTGLLQYNRADANLRSAGNVMVNNVPAAWVFSHLTGMAQYFSAGGLLLREVDRFGNTIDYTYSNMHGSPTHVTLTGITDTWGNPITIAACSGASCKPGEVTITLPDGRTAGWVAPDQDTITEMIDTGGMRTVVTWGRHGACMEQPLLPTGMTTPTGGMTALDYECLEVCRTAATGGECSQKTTWPVVSAIYQCANNPSGDICTATSSPDSRTTTHSYTGATNNHNYTGYPMYSPYEPTDPNADALMSSGDTSYVYTTTTSTESQGKVIHAVDHDYTYLHLLTEQRVTVASAGKMALSKETSYCYPLPSTSQQGVESCDMNAADYRQLPSNYQSRIKVGSCQHNVGAGAVAGQGRQSLVEMEHDGFGKTINRRVYHGTRTTGTLGCSDRRARLSANQLKLVLDSYMEHDTPDTLGADKYVKIGPDSGQTQYGLPKGQQSFIYRDEDESGSGVHGALGQAQGPALVKLMCNEFVTGAAAGTNIETTTVGLMATGASPPKTVGIVDACMSGTSWTGEPAPPKSTTFQFADEHGRSTGHTTAWVSGYTPQEGIPSTSATMSYTLTAAAGCGSGDHVLEITATDPQGNKTTHQVCTLNGWHLSSTDANGNTTSVEHDSKGMETLVTEANGTTLKIDYYHACPTAQDGKTPTCPDPNTPKNCPFDDGASGPKQRNCSVHTRHGSGSYVDGVSTATIRDGLGRVVATADNRGGASGQGYTKDQVRSTVTYDDRGLIVAKTAQVGATTPLVYETTSTYGPKLRPRLVCGPRGGAHEYVHDDVVQQTKAIFNGSDREAYQLNDSQKLTSIVNCELTAGQTSSGSGACPTVAADPSTTTCGGAGYHTDILHDGSGVVHQVVASAGSELDPGASIVSVSGNTTFSAEMLKYAYTHSSTLPGGDGVSGTSNFFRDLQGNKTSHELTVTNPDKTSHSFSSDTYKYNNISELLSEENKLSKLPDAPTLANTYTYTPTKQRSTLTSYEGATFHHYYDDLNRVVRHCIQLSGRYEGENLRLDPITGKALVVQHFTGQGTCSECKGGTCADVVDRSEHYVYNRFGGLETLRYDDGTELQWAYDSYQRPTCFADALATNPKLGSGKGCPPAPTAADFSTTAEDLLLVHEYYPDDTMQFPYRRGLLKSTSRGVPDGSGGFVNKYMEVDYYTPKDVGGACAPNLKDVVGAYAGLVKKQEFCTGGPCSAGGTLVYATTHQYDRHRRPCVVESVNASGKVILGSKFAYDQYNNVTHEEHYSDLSATTDMEQYLASNYQVDYQYDGLMRVIGEKRQSYDKMAPTKPGALIHDTTYEYNAASNVIGKVKNEPDPPATPTAVPPTATATATAQPPLGDPPPATAQPPLGDPPPATPAPTASPSVEDDDGCQIQRGSPRSSWFLLIPVLLLLAGRRASRRRGPWCNRLMRGALAALMVIAVCCGPLGAARAKTTRTMYKYNADGQLTAISEQVDTQPATTTILTWDNFEPSAADPTTGTVRVGNGTLMGWGPSPGGPARFAFDARDRLTAYTGERVSETYAYHAKGTMAQSKVGGDALDFYYDARPNAQVTNIHQTTPDLWSGYLGGVRYLSDGSEQVVLTQRKDVAGTYEPATEKLSSYVYEDVYGAQSTPLAQGYDLHDNPFQYAGEYRDPIWGGTYLRARWYHPDLPAFLSRDPLPHLNRYGYAGGNAVMRTDPSGQSWAGFTRALRSADATLNRGVGGIVARLLLGPLLSALDFLSHPKAFWQAFTHDTDYFDVFLIAGVALEFASAGTETWELTSGGPWTAPWRNLSLKARFGTRLAVDLGLGGGQAVAVGADRGFHHFNWSAFGKNLELTVGSLFASRYYFGVGYNPYTHTGNDVLSRVRALQDDDTVLIFRERTRQVTGTTRYQVSKSYTSPYLESLEAGHYHERIVAVSKKFTATSEFRLEGDFVGQKSSFAQGGRMSRLFQQSDSRFEFVGRANNFDLAAFREANPRGLLTAPEVTELYPDRLHEASGPGRRIRFHRWNNNCHQHAQAVLRGLDIQ